MSALAYKRMELYSALAKALKPPSMALLGKEHFLFSALDKFSKEGERARGQEGKEARRKFTKPVLERSEGFTNDFALWHVQAIQNEAKKLALWLNDLSKACLRAKRKVTASKALGQLEVEYNRLFYGPFAPLVYPYESVYLDADGLVMSQSAVVVLRQYREVGLAISPEFKDLPDHIVVELEFMAYLCAKEAEAHALKQAPYLSVGKRALEYLRKERDFIKKHLSVWVFTFCDRIIATSKSVFYPCLARILSAYLCWDEKYVTTKLETIETETTKNHALDRREGIENRREGQSEGRKRGAKKTLRFYLDVDKDKCTLCGTCAHICSTEALRIQRQDDRGKLIFNPARCNGCGYCTKNCPANAISLSSGSVSGQTDDVSERVVIFQVELAPCISCGKPYLPKTALAEILEKLGADAATEPLRHATMCCPQCKRMSLSLS